MAFPVTICGLIAEEGHEPFAWQTGHYWKELAEPDPAVAVEFLEQDIDREALDVGTITTFLAASVHLGNYPRCSGIPNADFEVNGDLEFSLHPTKSLYTVCGIYLDNGETYQQEWMSHGQRVAYVDAWRDVRDDQARTLLVACVHEGSVPRGLEFRFALPSIKNEDEMKQAFKELWTP
jgi:hypothetical protein